MILAPGVHSVLPTPFRRDESLDEASLRTLVDYYESAGVAGLLVLGVLGEEDKLSDAERERVQAVVLEHAAGPVQVTVGITHGGTAVAAERARDSERAGAAAVLLAPPRGSVWGPAVLDHYRRVADGLSISVLVQDYPVATGVKLPVDFLVELADELPPGSGVKLEDPPTPVKIAALRKERPLFTILSGLNGTLLLHELTAGADGVMTGFAPPSILVEIVAAHQAGEAQRARELYERALPLIVFESQPVIGLRLRKEVLRRAGALEHSLVRQPAGPFDERLLATLHELIGEVLNT
jgi:4-hydroxy-tetrahydrodipicolinate synthase